MALIEFRGVTKLYKGDVQALRHVNFSVEKGDTFGVIGSSGAGKSTLLRCLSTLEKPSFGQIIVKGELLSELKGDPLRKMRQEMGLVFQHFNLFSSRTVWENIAYPLEIAGVEKEEAGRRVSELIGLVGLDAQQSAYPTQLSGGQKQRVGIARALANAPEILLCDEATSALDPKTTDEILKLIKTLQKELGLTVVLITHEMEVVKAVCNKVAVLSGGEVVEEGPLSQIFAEPKHKETRAFVQKTIHEIPRHLLSGKGKVVHLHFKGTKADQPVIAKMVRMHQVDANILLGWIDSLQSMTVGNLILELTGEGIDEAITFLKNQGIGVEEVDV